MNDPGDDSTGQSSQTSLTGSLEAQGLQLVELHGISGVCGSPVVVNCEKESSTDGIDCSMG